MMVNKHLSLLLRGCLNPIHHWAQEELLCRTYDDDDDSA